MNTRNAPALLGVIWLCASPAAAQAQSPASTPADSSQPPASTPPLLEPAPTGLTLGEPVGPASDFHLAFTPYLWMTNFNGKVGVKGVQLDLDKSFIDVLNDSDLVFGLMGSLDIEYKRFLFQLNTAWATVQGVQEQASAGDGALEANVDVDGVFVEFFGGYRLLDTAMNDPKEDQGAFKLDAYIGGRVTAVNIDTTLYALTSITLPDGDVIPANQSTDRNKSGDWIEPFIGLRGIINLDRNWAIQVRGDVGGFGVYGSQFAWQVAAVIAYQWHLEGWDISLVGGYRALGQDYSNEDFSWDVVTHGPLLGVSFAWSF